MTPEENPKVRIVRNLAQLKLLVVQDMKLALAQARAEAPEEAARVAEGFSAKAIKGKPAWFRCARDIAAAIRGMK